MPGSKVRHSFDIAASAYDASRRLLLPCFDDFYGMVPMALGELGEAPVILDLGAGTGLLSRIILAAIPQARLTLMDFSAPMLEVARAHFGERAAIVEADYAGADLGGPYDAVVSAVSIHHLDDPAKRALFQAIHAALRPGGLFVNADQIHGPTPALERWYHAQWLAQVRALGVAEDALAAAIERQRLDRHAPLEPQLEWLRQAGFTEVDCLYKNLRFAVYGGKR